MNLLNILKFSEEYLSKYSFSKPRLESEKIISYVLNIDRIALYLNYDKELSEEEKQKIKEILKIMVNENMNFDDVIKLKSFDTEKNFTNENKELLTKSIEYLKQNDVADSVLDAEYIFSHVLGIKRSILTFNFKSEITSVQKDEIKKLLKQRAKDKKPLQYILGEWEFYGLDFIVDERALIPRPDTEILVEQCICILENIENAKVLDIGTGSGVIAIAIAKKIPTSQVLASDISKDSLELAVKNRKLNDVEKNLKFIKSDVFSNIKEKDFDMIISNPPYIPKNEYNELMPEVKLHEPKNALTDRGDGYYFYKKISQESGNYLKNGGYLAFEVGYNQADSVSEIMQKEKFEIIAIVKDYSRIDRVVIGKRMEK